MTAISNNEIAKAIYLVSKNKTGSEQTAVLSKVVSFLARRHLLGKSGAILTQLGKIANLDTGAVEAKVSSAKSLDEKTKRDLAQILIKRYRAKEVIIKEKIDESMLGGFRVEVNDEVIDLTVKNKIRKLQEYLTRSI